MSQEFAEALGVAAPWQVPGLVRAPDVPDPATLSWLLRKASLDVVHARRMVKVAELTAVADTPRWGKAIIAADSAFATRSWLADIIREKRTGRNGMSVAAEPDWKQIADQLYQAFADARGIHGEYCVSYDDEGCNHRKQEQDCWHNSVAIKNWLATR